MTHRLAFLTVALLIAGIPLAGCGGPAEQTTTNGGSTAASSGNGGETGHAHHSHDDPLTDEQTKALEDGLASYEDALSKIKSYRDKIRDEIAAGEPAHAHRPLDELNVVLNKLTEVARDNNVPKSDWEAVNTNAQTLRDEFNKVHAQIDAGQEPDYDSVSASVDTAIAALEAIKASESGPSDGSN